jgi:hypothetical protein
MINKILNGWNWRRILYTSIGVMLMIQSFILREWFGVILGLYFTSMGLFAFGCAGNQCLPYVNEEYSLRNAQNEKVNYEEVNKNK